MSYGFLITTYNDAKEAVEMFKSLTASIPASEAYGVIVVDGGSSEEDKKLIQHEIGAIVGEHKDLSSALNIGYDFALRAGIEHIIWLHQDMSFHDLNWAKKLCWCYDHCFPMFGKLCPGTRNIDNSTPDVPLRGGNSCPTLIRSDVVRDLIARDGYVYDPKFLKCYGREDWDQNRRLLELGYGFGICSLVDVFHVGMGTRSRYDSKGQDVINADVYYNKWNMYNEPGFEIDLTEIGKELRESFEKKFDNYWYKR